MMANWDASNQPTKVVVLDGALNIQRIGELKEAFAAAFTESDHVVLDLARGTEVDLSFLQLVCAAHKSASRTHKQLTLSGERPECLRQAIEEAGFLPLKGCRDVSGNGCLWKGEGR